ncbi:kinesin member 20B [Aspergillus nanangensis]|uniref:Kinesin member 20B n=1 Tax=Aspergillus nanangensis TaxID=2582783 RepID=A0AAD4CTY6_ASPNN|nr:kinesin member 20B [Aspergillus nanangensis]
MTEMEEPLLAQLLQRWENVHQSVMDFAPTARLLSRIEEIMDNNKLLEQEIRTLGNKLDEAEQKSQDLQRSLEEKETSHQTTCKRMAETFSNVQTDREIELLEKNTKERTMLLEKDAELKRFEREVTTLKIQVSTTSDESREKETTIQRIRIERSQLLEQYNNLKAAVGMNELDQSFNIELGNLSKKISDLCQTSIGGESVEEKEGGKDKTFEMLQRSSFLRQTFPIPISNSFESQKLRAAVARTFIAEQVTKRIFRETPRLPRWTGLSPIHEELQHFAERYPLREAALRSIMVTAYSEDEKECDEREIDKILDEVCYTFKPLITENDAFRGRLRDLLNEATHLWSRARANIDRVSATVNPSSFNTGFERYDLDEACSFRNDDKDALCDALVLFPRIFISNRNKSEVLHPGTVLMSNSALVNAAQIEAKEQMARFHAKRRP